jgi:hypothetical protein
MENIPMKKSWLMIVLLITIVSLSGCGRVAPKPSQSDFKSNFSLNAVVENNKQFLLEEARHSSGAESGLQEPFVQSHEEMIIQIDPNNLSKFMAAIRSDIEQALIDSDAHMLGSEGGSNDTEHFSFSYSENEIQGTIHVWGFPSKGTNFTIIALITES